MNLPVRKAIINGMLATTGMLAVYLGILSLTASWDHALDLLREDSIFVGSLAGGFGIQIGLYTYLKRVLNSAGSNAGTITGISGSSSTASMVACCVHHITDLLPFIGISAVATFLGQYKSWLMAGALLFNLIGIGMLVNQLVSHWHIIKSTHQTVRQQSV